MSEPARYVRLWALFAEAGVLPVDQVRLDRPQRVIVDADPFRDAQPKVDQHDIDISNQTVNRVSAALVLEIEDQAALTAVQRLEPLPLPRDHRAGVADRLTARRLDLDHVSPEVRQVDAADRCRNDLRELQHANAGQRSRERLGRFEARVGHRCLLVLRSREGAS